MLAERLGRLFGAVLMLAALVGGVLAGDVTTTSAYDWTSYFGDATLSAPAATGLSV